MNSRNILFAALFFLFSAASVCRAIPQQPAGAHLVLAGSGTNLAITRLLAAEFSRERPDIILEVPGSIGTTGAVRAVSEGAITIALASRTLNEAENRLGLTLRPYAKTALVIAANSSVTDDAITFQQLVEIFRGTRTRWKDGNEILVLSREKSDSGFQILRKVIPGFEPVYLESIEARRWALNFTDQDSNRALSKQRFSLGVTDVGMIETEKLDVKILKLNGMLPTPEDVASSRYPLVRTLYFVFRKDKLPPEAESFLTFVYSERGAEILRSYGYLPAN
ncbi:MAG: substrate-binding domain-containing protein [Desulfobacteraceae bacterium]|nr:substrate-binding domain-containing protein [Desulfobacteraceae bacterium]